MLKLIISIIVLSIIGIVAISILLNYILHKIFYLPHILNTKTPEDYDIKSENKYILTRHQKKIQIWDINKESKGPVLVGIHGWANTSDSLLPLAKTLSDTCRVVLINSRNHGDSDDEKYMTMVKYSEDIIAVLNHLESENPELNEFILLGHSLGGAAALLTASRDDRVKQVISVGVFADLEAMMRDSFLKNRLPRGFAGSLLTYIEIRIGEKLENISPVKTVSKFSRPVLLVHGTKDKVADFSNLGKIRKAALRENVKELVMKGFGHSDLLADDKLATEILQFIKKYT